MKKIVWINETDFKVNSVLKKKIRTYPYLFSGLSCMIKHGFILGQNTGTVILKNRNFKAIFIKKNEKAFLQAP